MTQPLKASLGTMMQQSAYVLARPSVASFERFERSGGAAQAFTYVGVVALVSALVALVRNLGGAPLWAGLEAFVVALVGFGVFAGVAYLFGRTQGATGTFDEVAYTLALSYVPIALVLTAVNTLLAITIVGLLLVPFVYALGWGVQIFYAFMGLQGSLNVRSPTVVGLVMIVSALAAWFAQMLLAWIL